jgi:phage protein D/phage baseplate assembly protein gpV
MPGSHDLASHYTVKVNGQELSKQHHDCISSISVERNLHLPDAFAITFHDTNMDSSGQAEKPFGLTDSDILPIGSEVEISLGRSQAPKTLFNGEVTAQDLEVEHGQAPVLVVRGFDRAHRLQRGRLSRSFLNVTDSDIATKIARECGLQPAVDSTSQVYPYVMQNNQTNLQFLQQRATRLGYEVYVEGTTLHFAKPKGDGAAAVHAKLGKDILRVQVHMTSAGQVQDVTVRGWDPKAKQAIVGRATRGASTARGGKQKSGAELAQPFGQAGMTISHHPVQSQAEADALAQAVADDLAGGAIRLEAEVRGHPGLKPGQVIDLSSLGSRFSGQYYVTGVCHRLGSRRPYTSMVTVSGRRSDTLLDWLVPPAHTGSHAVGPAVVVGVVTNNKDDQGLGRVKVKLPWFGDDESDWARIVTPSAGSGRGIYWLPEVNDEVLVAFEHGDPHRPFILGGLWNGQDKPPKDNSSVVDGGGAVTKRIIQSRSGHTITLDDSSGGGSITIADSSGSNVITIDTSSNKITLSAQGDLELKAVGTVKVSGMAVQVESQANCDIKANGMCNVKGAMINLN